MVLEKRKKPDRRHYDRRNGVLYFSHDYNARNSEELAYIRSIFGAEGYGLYWMFIEYMHQNESGKLKKSLLSGLELQFGVSKEKLDTFYSEMIKTGLFCENSEEYWSERVLNQKDFLKTINITLSEKRSNAGKKGASKRWGK